jgi:DNA-binding beta-propeller fold protein YncE
VLIWNKLPTVTNTPADVVVGQRDFTSNTVPEFPTNSSLDHPEGLAVGGGKLFVSDRNNNRVLIWNSIPSNNGAPADVVLGQPDFTSRAAATSRTGLSSPDGIWTDGKRLAVADFFNNRVLIWNSIPASNGAPADVVVGQAHFNSLDSPEPPDARSLSEPLDVSSDGKRLFVADSGNNRVLVYRPFPTANHAAAKIVLGQPDFSHDEPNAGGSVSAKGFAEPTGVSYGGGELFVADFDNDRVLVFSGK